MLSRLKPIALVLLTAVLLIGAIAAFAGCQAETKLTRVSETEWRTALPDGSTFTFTRTLNGQSTAKAPGATSQPTVATLDDYAGTASASGQQEPPILPALAYDAKTRAYIFYGGAALFLAAGVYAMYRGKRQLALFCGIAFFLMLGAQTFIDRWAWSIFPIILVIGAIWGAVWYVTTYNVRKRENRETAKTALKAADAGADASTVAAIVSSSPAGRDAAAELARESS